MKKILTLLLVIILFSLFCIVPTGMFIGIGYIFFLIFPLTLFQASFLCSIAAFVFTFITVCLILGIGVRNSHWLSDSSDEDDDEEMEEEAEDDDDEEELSETDLKNIFKVGRNTPCPCGSGKKFKFCCGK